MGIIYQGCEILATMAETYIILDFLSRFLNSKFSGIKKNLTFFAAFILINLYMLGAVYMIPQYLGIQDIIVLVLYILYSVLCTKGNRILRIITPALIITVILIINLIVLSIFSMILNLQTGELVLARNTERIMILLLTKLLFFLVTQIVLRKFKPREFVLSNKEFFAVVSSFLCSVIIIVYFAESQFHPIQEGSGVVTIIVLSSVVVTNIASSIMFVMLVKASREKNEHFMIQLQFHEQQKMYQSICSAYKNLEILQHDMKNDLLSLQSMLHQNKMKEAEHYLEQYTKTKLEQFQIFVHTGQELIDAVINIKLNYAREQQIDVSCQISANIEPFDPEDIVSLFSNAIDNAIESSVNQTRRHIYIVMEDKRNYLHISIGDAVDKSVLDENSELKTTKKEKKYHGFGKQSMMNIVQKYEGMMEYYESNGIFFVDFLLKNTKQEEKTTKQEKSID